MIGCLIFCLLLNDCGAFVVLIIDVLGVTDPDNQDSSFSVPTVEKILFYLPCHSGFRFSENALGPSCASILL